MLSFSLEIRALKTNANIVVVGLYFNSCLLYTIAYVGTFVQCVCIFVHFDFTKFYVLHISNARMHSSFSLEHFALIFEYTTSAITTSGTVRVNLAVISIAVVYVALIAKPVIMTAAPVHIVASLNQTARKSAPSLV